MGEGSGGCGRPRRGKKGLLRFHPPLPIFSLSLFPVRGDGVAMQPIPIPSEHRTELVQNWEGGREEEEHIA